MPAPPLKGEPLPGQGQPLPSDCPHEGEWLLWNSLFLARTASSSDKPQLTLGFQTAEGKWCAGFDATLLANAFGISVDALFEANRAGTLTLLGVEDAPSRFGGVAAKNYAFAFGHKVSVHTIEAVQASGN